MRSRGGSDGEHRAGVTARPVVGVDAASCRGCRGFSNRHFRSDTRADSDRCYHLPAVERTASPLDLPAERSALSCCRTAP
jgi:hypothetical protein